MAYRPERNGVSRRWCDNCGSYHVDYNDYSSVEEDEDPAVEAIVAKAEADEGLAIEVYDLAHGPIREERDAKRREAERVYMEKLAPLTSELGWQLLTIRRDQIANQWALECTQDPRMSRRTRISAFPTVSVSR